MAPILLARCAPCHRPGQIAPFSLLTYEDARRRARDIARVTAEKRMPPWLPDPSDLPFLDERRLEIIVDNARRFVAAKPRRNVVDKAMWF